MTEKEKKEAKVKALKELAGKVAGGYIKMTADGIKTGVPLIIEGGKAIGKGVAGLAKGAWEGAGELGSKWAEADYERKREESRGGYTYRPKKKKQGWIGMLTSEPE